MHTRECYNKEYGNLDNPYEGFSMSLVLSVANIFRYISDRKALILFKDIALSESYDTSILITRLRLTHKQYHSRMEKLMRAGLIKRINDKYHPTSFGMVFFSSYVRIETAIKYFWKLKAIDSIMMMSVEGKKLPAQELQRIIDILIHNQEMKDILALKGTLRDNMEKTSE
jgi:hypothetical protein